MTIEEQIRDSLKRLAGEVGPAPTVLAMVVGIDQATQTVQLKDDDGTLIDEVRLRPVLDGQTSIVQFPKSGTWCLAVRIEDGEEWMAVAFGEIDSWQIKTGISSFIMDTNGFVFQKGLNTLWTGLKTLIESLEPVVIAQGTNIDRAKLLAAKAVLKSVLNGA